MGRQMGLRLPEILTREAAETEARLKAKHESGPTRTGIKRRCATCRKLRKFRPPNARRPTQRGWHKSEHGWECPCCTGAHGP